MPRITQAEAHYIHELLLSHGKDIEKFSFFRDQCQDRELERLLGDQVRKIQHHYEELLSFVADGSNPNIQHGAPTGLNRSYGQPPKPQPMQPNTQGTISDRAMAADALVTSKNAAVQCTQAATEASNSALRRSLVEMTRDHLDMAFEMYRFMESRGWYASAGSAPPTWVQQGYQQPSRATGGYREEWVAADRNREMEQARGWSAQDRHGPDGGARY